MNEVDICNLVIELLSEKFDKNKFGIEQRADSYLSLIYCDNDFFRVKYTDRSKWISIRLAKEDMNVNDERFKAQTNKKQFHWKADISNEQDIYKFKKELFNACKYFVKDTYEARNINHGKIIVG